MRFPRLRFAHQVLSLQVAVVVVLVGVGYGLAAWLLPAELNRDYGERALSVARSVAADPSIGAQVAGGDPRGEIQRRAEAVRKSTGALFVVVTNGAGIRLAHPDPDQIGEAVSTDPSGPLSGHEVVNVERGTLGMSARGKVPLRDPSGTIVGEVSVGFETRAIDQQINGALRVAGLFAGGALLLGIAGSIAIGRRLKRQTLGLEPAELTELVRDREAVLHGIGEGVVAVDSAGRLRTGNTEAARLLGVELRDGDPASGLDLPERLRSVLTGHQNADNRTMVVGDRVLVVNSREVRRGTRALGVVTTIRDRTDVETLSRELDTVRTLFDALRAQRHEYANRLHTLSGLLQLDHHKEAGEYLRTLVAEPPVPLAPGGDGLSEPYLQAFLSAKTAVASEKGVALELGEGTWLRGRLEMPLDVTTVLGNLVDNALEAARAEPSRPPKVTIEVLGDGATLYLTVADSGSGVPAELREEIFLDGVSTRQDDRPRGLGLTLARQAARAAGGDVVLASPGGDGQGAVFVAHLPGVIRCPDEVVAP